MTRLYEGSCHCGTVRFRATIDRTKVVACNCSICRKKGARYLRLAPEEFELLSGRSTMKLYQFGTNIARHLFCPNCGIHAFGQPRSAPDTINVNIQCLESTPDDAGFDFVYFDGQHWEEGVAELNRAMASK